MGKKVIIRSPNWIGDHVMARDFYRGVRRSLPDAHVTLLCPSSVAELPFRELLDETLVLAPEDRRFPNLRRFGRALGEKGFDLAFSLPASFSSAALLLFSGIPERIGFSGDWNRALYTRAVRWTGREAGRHKTELYLELLKAAGLGAELAAELPPPAGDRERVIVIAPGASLPLREWPYFSELLEALPTRLPGWRFRVVGSPAETKWKSLIARKASPALEDWVGQTSLPELVSLCRGARLVLANDSGVAHVAASLSGTPTLVLFGPGDPVYVKPRGESVTVLRRPDVPCSPCEKAHCRAPHGYQQCLRALSVDEVAQAVVTAANGLV